MNFVENQPSVAVLGAGLMGCAIAAVHLKAGIPVLLYDTMSSALTASINRVAAEWDAGNFVPSSHFDFFADLPQMSFNARRLHLTDRLEDLRDCRIVLETIPEKIRLKHKLYNGLRDVFRTDSLLFSNTSTISITDLAPKTPDPSRFCGFHFFHPVRHRPIVEIIAGKTTSPETVEAAKAHALAIRKKPLCVGDGPGFLVNRLLNPYLNEALVLLEEGVQVERIETLATEYGMAAGPLRIMDEIGLDVTLHSGWVLSKAFPDRAVASPLLVDLVAAGHLGRKTGTGFFLHSGPDVSGGKIVVNTDFIERYVKNASDGSRITDAEILDRLFFGMLLEALRCIEDGIAESLGQANFAAVYGLGYPMEREGLDSPVREHGFEATRQRLEELERRLGSRFRPSGLFFRLFS